MQAERSHPCSGLTLRLRFLAQAAFFFMLLRQFITASDTGQGQGLLEFPYSE